MVKPLRVLSIDGGGMRGIIPALVLQEIEVRSGRRIVDLFDLIVGTSTGGILALGASLPGSDNRPAFSASELVEFYTVSGSRIFPGGGTPTAKERLLGRGGTLYDQMNNAGQRVGAIFGGNPRFAGNARYLPTGLTTVLAKAFGNSRISSALVDVAITSYDATSATAIVFSRSDALRRPEADLLMADAARATSAAPTFFPPLKGVWDGAPREFVDGGVWANNPSLLALSESIKMTAARSVPSTNVILVSLGTGKIPPKP